MTPTNLPDELILQMLDATGARAKVVRHLIICAKPGGVVLASARSISAAAGVNEKTAATVLAELRAAGLCVRIGQGGGAYKLQIVPCCGTDSPPGVAN
jgi:DNA-binding IscR family transcriptional regulator